MNHTAETLPDNTELLKEIILKQAQRIASLEEFIRLEKWTFSLEIAAIFSMAVR